jgi:hypothetical protein
MPEAQLILAYMLRSCSSFKQALKGCDDPVTFYERGPGLESGTDPDPKESCYRA